MRERLLSRPRLLDLFCGAGGCSVGYARAGFDVVGVDTEPHPAYPFRFWLADALDVLADTAVLDAFDVVHASPPCQTHSRTAHLAKAQGHATRKRDHLQPTLEALRAWGGVWVVENVPGAPMPNPSMVCGRAFGLRVQRHRLFSSDVLLLGTDCMCDSTAPIGVYHRMNDQPPNGGRTARTLAEGQAAMGIDWMTWADLKEAIPPAYTEYLGEQLLAHLAVGRMSDA